MIQWPCVFKLEGDAELMYLASASALASVLDSLIWSHADYLVDTVGNRYLIIVDEGQYRFEQQDAPLSLEEVTQLIQEHEFSKAEMCLTKIQFASVQDAIQSLAYEV